MQLARSFLNKSKMPVDYADFQGLLRFGYAKMTEAAYVLLKMRNPARARAWISSAPVTTAVEMNPQPRTALQIAFTGEGLEELGVPDRTLASFSAEFLSGLAGEENRSRRLGDTGPNSPKDWRWGVGSRVPHAVVMLFAEPGQLGGWTQSIRGASWQAAFEEIAWLPTSDMGGREAFGFIDGISQPDIDWAQVRQPPVNRDELQYGNILCIGEFLLGYRNEYGKYTDRPLLDPREPGSEELREATDQPGKKDLGLNGTYVVMRQLQQDVRGFWQFLDRVSGCNPTERYKLASALVGRRLSDGTPLVPLSEVPIPGVATGKNENKRKLEVQQNQFTYDRDASGTHCPFGAHIRRGNPRNADLPGNPKGLVSHLVRLLGFGNQDPRADLIASARFHRLLRRGREYGEKLTPEEALQPAPPGDPERGLHFIALNANIERQFEFVQNAWMMGTKFNGLTEESDPLLGNREDVRGCPSTDAFSIPRENGTPNRIMHMPQFVTMRGGAYFFLPSIRALKYLSRLGS